MDRKERYYMSSVRLGPKGQIVIPMEARDMFGLQPGDTLEDIIVKVERRPLDESAII